MFLVISASANQDISWKWCRDIDACHRLFYSISYLCRIDMAVSTFQKITFISCIVLCMSLFLPKFFLPRVKKETVQSEGKMRQKCNPSFNVVFCNVSADLTIPVISVLRSPVNLYQLPVCGFIMRGSLSQYQFQNKSVLIYSYIF